MDEKENHVAVSLERRGSCCGLSPLACRLKNTGTPPSNDPQEIKNDVLKLIAEAKKGLL
jgi:hypothetical protein